MPLDRYILYTGSTAPTGRKLQNFLGIEGGTSMPDERYDYLLRWGTSQSIRYIPEIQTYNRKSKIQANTDKLNSLKVMDEADIPVPQYTTDIEDVTYPVLARQRQHSQGRDVQLVLQERDLRKYSYDFFTDYIPKKNEYRVHVVNGSVVKVSQKLVRNDVDSDSYNPVVWNYETGFVFGHPRQMPSTQPAINAVEALELDFGAVDLIIDERTDQPFVLEVNTAPSLSQATLPVYARQFQHMLELDSVPGMQAVDFDDE